MPLSQSTAFASLKLKESDFGYSQESRPFPDFGEVGGSFRGVQLFQEHDNRVQHAGRMLHDNVFTFDPETASGVLAIRR